MDQVLSNHGPAKPAIDAVVRLGAWGAKRDDYLDVREALIRAIKGSAAGHYEHRRADAAGRRHLHGYCR
jgi:hypothetical protein